MPPSPRDSDYRPLLPYVPRFTSDGMEIDLAGRKVSVTGPPGQLAAIAALSNGRYSAAAIATAVDGVALDDLGELFAALARAGAVVDTSEAWRVFHRWTAVDSPLGRPVELAELVAMLDERYEQPGADGGGEGVTLDPSPTSLDGLLARRRSSQEGDPAQPVSFPQLSALLGAMYGGDGPTGRPVPSGGGLYPLAIHVLLRSAVGQLAPGVWWFDPAGRRLRSVTSGPPPVESAFAQDRNTLDRLSRGQPVVIVSADVARGARKYASRAYRLALMEVGAAMQNAYLVATDLDVPIRALLGIDDAGVTDLLKLPDGAVPLLALLVGQ